MKKWTLLLIVLIGGFVGLFVAAKNMSVTESSSGLESEPSVTVVTNTVINTVTVTNVVAVTSERTAVKMEPRPERQTLPRRVALIVQNHTSDAPALPMAAFADTLTSRLSGKMLRVVNPHNVIGVDQNRTAKGEIMPEASAQEIARKLNADGVVTASIDEFTGEDIQWKGEAVAHTLKVRLALNLADSATGETICGVDGVEFSENYTAEKVKSNTATLYEGLMHGAAAKASEKLLAKVATIEWNPGAAKLLNVFFGCNVLGADIQVDGQSYGTCPAQLALTPGSHNLLVSYPPYYHEFRRCAMFKDDGQTYAVVLQLNAQGEAQRNRGLEYEAKLVELKKSQAELEKLKNDNSIDYEKKKQELENEKELVKVEMAERADLFAKQLELTDAMLERYGKSGETDDYVRRTVADGTAVYWKNSYGRIAITSGNANKIDFATPATDVGDIVYPPEPGDIGKGLRNLLMQKPSWFLNRQEVKDSQSLPR